MKVVGDFLFLQNIFERTHTNIEWNSEKNNSFHQLCATLLFLKHETKNHLGNCIWRSIDWCIHQSSTIIIYSRYYTNCDVVFAGVFSDDCILR